MLATSPDLVWEEGVSGANFVHCREAAYGAKSALPLRETKQNLYFSSLHKIISILALFSSLSPFSSAGSSWLLSLSRFFPFFLPLTNPIDRVGPNRCLKVRHEAVSFEAAEWSERLTSWRVGWLGAATIGSIPTLVTFFSFSSLLLLLLLLPIFLLSETKRKTLRFHDRCQANLYFGVRGLTFM